MMKKKRDWKQIRNAFVMVCVAVAMLSTATYAWFTMTNQPSVTGMNMTASSVGGLSVSKAVGGPFDGTTASDVEYFTHSFEQ